MRREQSQGTAVACALLAAMLYAVGTPLSKVLLQDVGPVMMAALLYLGAGIGLLALGGARRLTGQGGRELPLTRRELPYNRHGRVGYCGAGPVDGWADHDVGCRRGAFKQF